MGLRRDIAEALMARVALVTKANGYTQDMKTVSFDRVRLNISDYKDYELPAAQFIDLTQVYNHEQSRSKTSWFIALELCMRTTRVIGEVDQASLWDLQEDVVRSIMGDPGLGIGRVQHVKLVDGVTDLHLQEPNYIATIGLEIMFYEPITRDNC